jgi:hypothetical protein
MTARTFRLKDIKVTTRQLQKEVATMLIRSSVAQPGRESKLTAGGNTDLLPEMIASWFWWPPTAWGG